MRDARVEDVEHGSGSDTDEKEESGPAGLNPEQVYTIGVFPSHQSPVYLHFSTKQEKVIMPIIFGTRKSAIYTLNNIANIHLICVCVHHEIIIKCDLSLLFLVLLLHHQ